MSAIMVSPLLYWGTAVVASLAAAAWQADRGRLDPWAMYVAGIAGFAGALLGGTGYVLFLSPDELHNTSQGRGVFGAFVGAPLLGWFALRLSGKRFLDYADAATPAVALGYAVYRIGCFLNGCCFGGVTDLPWAVTLGPGTEAFASQVASGLIAPDAARTLPVHPTQFYHAAAGMVGFLFLVRLRDSAAGARLALALAFYGATRFVIEFFRGDAQPVWGPLDVNQLACAAMLLIAAGLWTWSARRVPEDAVTA